MKRFADIQSKVPIVKLNRGRQTSLHEMNAMTMSGNVNAMMNNSGAVNKTMSASGAVKAMQTSGAMR